jgi:beta-glucosidase
MDRAGHTPAFPFGFGLSYTAYDYKNLQLDREEIGADGMLRVSVEVTNRGHFAGEEVAQLYIGYEGSEVERPLRELKGFLKVNLAPGETKRAVFTLAARQLAYYREQSASWILEPITYTVYVGPSSRTEELLSVQFSIRE